MATINGFNPEQVILLPQKGQLLTLMTIIRDVNTTGTLFTSTVQRVARQLLTLAVDSVPLAQEFVETPVGKQYAGWRPDQEICGVSILRAGASMEQALRDTWVGPLSFGNILIQRDEETFLPQYLYCKLPSQIPQCRVLLLEPMLATGGSVIKAVELLIEKGVPENQIILCNVIASKQGLEKVTARFGMLRIITAAVDENMTEKNYISPGLGDFGDRYYGTTG
ncbi:uracil phosphoribosyltransferase [Aspergillus clavatus NRRL 1]|uniref:uracil phosphoribosyltransferase n=1 Tax=Aspergillus clavatus (strain ATCC 1007 / CBS 513.65 / DSM 816 / NCTC 3887 / NRRL 1 / QM 1276 / 107) TaxID=344612 RepID=A1C4H4_ASPCL|nr:uracil phosphoribosyltransferase [Aspergillus clavatus NRRL 1]EAW15314.1 uracil phosphoribosyltransferase [Aspergillus clavatus NRRL 1]